MFEKWRRLLGKEPGSKIKSMTKTERKPERACRGTKCHEENADELKRKRF